ncbi:MAG: pilus assembly protein [Firmicutes bacterium]|nr:pilus assembly protein [Bacillota bacterium]
MKIFDDKGSAAIILCLLFTALLGFTAYVIDIGLVYAEKIKLANALDSAALAAILELPDDSEKARAVAIDYLEKNNVDPDSTVITIGSDQKSIEIKGVKNVKHLFGPVVKINSSDVNVTTKAIIGPAKSVKGGIRPFAVEIFDYSYGSLVILKENAGDGYKGNYGAVALGGKGANVFKENALYGYSGTISVGDLIETETGNMAGAANAIKNYINSEHSSFDNFSRNSVRLWTVPLVDTLETNGRGQISVIGFGQFYVEDIVQKSGKIEIIGRFVRYVANAVIDMTLNDTGVYGAKLIK